MNKKLLSIIMSVALLVGSFGMAFGADVTSSAASEFSDMPDNWSTAALNKAVENGLLTGYAESGKKLIKAGNFLTRAEMATVVNRVFASEKVSDLSKVSDVSSSAWYAKDMAKAVKMGTFSYDTKMRPGDNITRQEAFTVLARAFKLVGTDANHKALNAFSDKDEIAEWALNSLDGMAEAGYIQGSGGILKPTANITRAEFATVMDNLVKDYLDVAGDVSEVVAKGNVIVRAPGVVLKDVTIKGDLIIADGVGEGDVTLEDVTVEGRTVVRGGGENSFIVKGNSNLGKIIVAKVDGAVRVFVEGGAEVDVVFVDDGSDEVVVEGKVGTLEVAGEGVTVRTQNATIDKLELSGEGATVSLGEGTAVKEAVVSGGNAGLDAGEGSKLDKVTISAPSVKVEGKGEVKEVAVKEGGDGAKISTPNTKTSNEGATGVESGGASVESGQTATNSSTGTGATVVDTPKPSTGSSKPSTPPAPTEITVSGLTKDYYGAGDTLEFTISGFKPNEEVKVCMPIHIGGDEKWASSKLVIEGMKGDDNDRYLDGEANENGEFLVSGKVQVGLPDGELHITLPNHGYTIDNAIGLGAYVGGAPGVKVTKDHIDEIIEGGITDVNSAIKKNGDYAKLGALDRDTGIVVVTITDGAIQVTNVYDHIVHVLINALNGNNDKVAKIYTENNEENSINLTGTTVEAKAIKDFVQASGLTGSSGAISGSDVLSVLNNQTLTGVVVDVNGEGYTYKVTFNGIK